MRYPSFCRINLETVFKIIILLGNCVLFTGLVLTNRITDYLHPRLSPFVIFGAVIFMLMAFSLRADFRKTGRRFSIAPYLIFLIPLVLAFTVPAKASGTPTLQLSSARLSGLTAPQSTAAGSAPGLAHSAVTGGAGASPSPTDNNESMVSGQASSSGQNGAIPLKPNQKAVYTKTLFGATTELVITDNTITLDDSNFVSWVSELDNSPGKYKGMKIQYTGYVYKSSDMNSGQFVVGRNMMWCCAADIQMIGCLCQSGKAAELKDNAWVTVEGTLSTSTWQGAETPLIVTATVTPGQKPSGDYVYP